MIDPTQEMPPIQAGGPLPFGTSQEAIEAWLAHWPDERVPALGELAPRAAAKRQKERIRLEALLREFEHDRPPTRAAGHASASRRAAELGIQRGRWE